MEKFKNLYHQYFDEIVAWYNGLELLYQFSVLFLLIVFCLFVATFVILSRTTK